MRGKKEKENSASNSYVSDYLGEVQETTFRVCVLALSYSGMVEHLLHTHANARGVCVCVSV